MLVYPPGSSDPIRGDLLGRVVLRTDLTPVPSTVEIEFRPDKTTSAIVVGATVKVGPSALEYLIVRVQSPQDGAPIQGGRRLPHVRAIGLLASCAAIANPLQRAVIKEGATLGEIYRACGAQVRIDSDFNVPQFSAFVGMTPSYAIAQVLQEEAGALVCSGARIQFRRLLELRDAKAARVVDDDICEKVESDLLERLAIPFGVSTSPDAGFVVGRRAEARRAQYRPRADLRILNNLGTVLTARRKLRGILATEFNAGTRFDVGGLRLIVITAAHVAERDEGAGSMQAYSQFWLGEVVQ